MTILSNRFEAARQEAPQYVCMLLETLGDRDPLAVLAETPDDVAALVAGVPEEKLRQPEAPGKWSLVEVVQHLADSDLVWGWRLRMVLAHERPEVTGYDQDAWAQELRYGDVPLADALDQLRVLRRIHLRLLASLTADQLARAGVHTERGEESVARMMQLYAAHDLVHRRQLRRIRAAVGA